MRAGEIAIQDHCGGAAGGIRSKLTGSRERIAIDGAARWSKNQHAVAVVFVSESRGEWALAVSTSSLE